MEKLNHYLFIIFIFILFSGCSYLENLKLSQQTTVNKNALNKLTKTIETIDKYYVYDIKLYKLINLTIDGLICELKDDSNKNLEIILKKEYAKSSDSKSEVYSKLIKVIEIVKNKQKYSEEKTVNLALKGLMTNLDPYSRYINQDITTTSKESTKIKSFSSETFEDKYLYLKVETFDANVVNNLKDKIINTNSNIKGIIIDLRDNTGGLLNQAIGTVDLFISEGVILSQRGRDTKNVIEYTASKKETISNLPLVILVNSKSASSSEIVSGALQDFKRATIVGEKTFGKGTIQILLPITEDKKEAIKLTIAKYYLPNGRLVDHKITPDINILQDENKREEDSQLASGINFLKKLE